ncbi:hypothetical protein [Thalassospira alkalitolerans]|jgi:hypothetical protein|uniref:hypothetical protein n=1 Tax=Thalassospira alkalitolerans TaxID=1293890 RepID=UPI0030EE247E|tara:strand:- start:49897 stop:50649 length:753 start_codon:yes stop_codon:yes gene_type:complete
MAGDKATRSGSSRFVAWGGGVFCGVIVLFVGLFNANAVQAQQSRCTIPGMPDAKLSFINRDPMLDRHRSVRWLNRRANQGSRYMVTGLTEFEMQAQFDMRIEPVEIGIGQFCLRPVRVSPQVEVVKHLVYVASELERGSCEYDIVYGHEGQHVQINQHMQSDVQRELDAMVVEIVDDFAAMRPVGAGEVARLQKRLLRQYGLEFKRRLRAIDLSRREDHRAIDTPDEYDRLSKACGPNSAFQTTLPQAMR